jgi:hypothetical protein
MKKLITLSLLIAIVVNACLLFNACSYEEDPLNQPIDESVPAELLDELKEWHKLETKQPGPLSIKKVKRSVLQPEWDKARLKKHSDEFSEVIAPVSDVKLTNPNVGLVRTMVFSINSGKVQDGKIVEIYGTAEYISENKERLLYKFTHANDFTGAMINYTVNYKYVNSFVYKNGGRIGNAQAAIKRFAKQNGKKNGIARLKETKCYTIYWVTWSPNDVEDWKEIGFTCEGSGFCEECWGTDTGTDPGGDGEGGGGPSGNVLSIPQDTKNPCNQAKALANNEGFKTKMKDLSSKTDLDREVGYVIGTNGSYNYVVGEPGKAEINFTVSSPIDGYMHTHYPGTFPCFSGTDINAIYEIYKGGFMNDPSTFSATVVTASGTTYLLKIEDVSKWDAWSKQKFGIPNGVDSFDVMYNLNMNWQANHDKSEIEAYEIAFKKVTDGSGLMLFRGDSENFNAWVPIDVGENDSLIISDCN